MTYLFRMLFFIGLVFLSLLIPISGSAIPLTFASFDPRVGLWYRPGDLNISRIPSQYVSSAETLVQASSDTSANVVSDYPCDECVPSSKAWVATAPATSYDLDKKVKSAVVSFTTSGLKHGIYFLRVIGRIQLKSGVSALPRIREPLEVHLEVNDGADPKVFNHYKMLMAYETRLREVAKVFFHAPHSKSNNELTLRLWFESRVQYGSLYVHYVQMHDPLGSIPARRAVKTQPSSYTLEERDAIRAEAEAWRQNNTGFNGPSRWAGAQVGLPATKEERFASDARIWTHVPPKNRMTQIFPWYTDQWEYTKYPVPAGKVGGTWSQPRNNYPNLVTNPEWRMVSSENANLTYSSSDRAAYKPLPDPFAWPDDGLGYYIPGSSVGKKYASPGAYTYHNVRATSYDDWARAIMNAKVRPFNEVNPAGQCSRYFLLGGDGSARQCAIILIHGAWNFAAATEATNFFYSASPKLLDYNAVWRWGYHRPVKGPYVVGLEAYDIVFPYIQNNQELADSVSRFIPWIQTPQDIIELLDTYYLQEMVMEHNAGRLEDLVVPSVARVLGPGGGDGIAKWVSYETAKVDVYPNNVKTCPQHYFGSFFSDGTSPIGSPFYDSEFRKLINVVEDYNTFLAQGGSSSFEIDVSQYLKFRGFCRWFYLQPMAGGFQIPVGDVAGTVWEGRKFAGKPHLLDYCYTLEKDPLYAYYIVQRGQGTFSDAEMNEITSMVAAANYSIPPHMRARSRIHYGFGETVLEQDGDGRYDDFRYYRSLAVRTGTGQGHAHSDTLDVQIFAKGLRASTDIGQRSESSLTTLPNAHTTYVHSKVEVDGRFHPWKGSGGWPSPGVQGPAWVEGYAGDHSDAQSVTVRARNSYNVTYYARGLTLMDADRDETRGLPVGVNPNSAVLPTEAEDDLPDSYVVDFFRVDGGKFHTYCFHGADSGPMAENFKVSVPMSPSLDAVSVSYLRKHLQGSGKQGVVGKDVLTATWALSRTSDTIANGCNKDGCVGVVKTRAAEQSIRGNSFFNGNSTRKYTRLHVLGRTGDTVLQGNIFSNPYKVNFPMFYVQRRTPDAVAATKPYADIPSLSTLYTAIIEPYAGSAFIESVESVTPTPNGADVAEALRPAAVGVKTKYGDVNLHYDDTAVTHAGSPGLVSRELSWSNLQMQVEARKATAGFRNGQLRVLSITEGRKLSVGGYTIETDSEMYSGTISGLLYSNKFRMNLDPPLPGGALLNGAMLRLDHAGAWKTNVRINYPIDNVSPDGSVGHLAEDPSMMFGTVLGPKPKSVPGLFEASPKTAVYTVGLVFCVDEAGVVHYCSPGYHSIRFFEKNTTAVVPVDEKTHPPFPDTNGDGHSDVVAYEVGDGDSFEIPTDFYLRVDPTEGLSTPVYIVRGNVGAKITVPRNDKDDFDRACFRRDNNEVVDVTESTGETQLTMVIPVDLLASGSAKGGRGRNKIFLLNNCDDVPLLENPTSPCARLVYRPFVFGLVLFAFVGLGVL